MVNDNHNFVNLSERNTGGVSEIKNYFGNLPKLICGNIHSEKMFLPVMEKQKSKINHFINQKDLYP
jgi:hypothetical protein